MSISINNTYGNYGANYSAASAQKTSTGKEADKTTPEKTDGVTSQIMELKTSSGGTKKEEIKTGFKNVDDYSKYLQDKYSYMNTGTKSMQGVPVSVNVSSAFLRKCMNDPEKAAYLEENLAAIPDCVSYAKSHALGTVTSISYEIDANGNITGIMSGTNDPDGKIAKENAEKKAEEAKEAKEKAAERMAERAKERKEMLEKLLSRDDEGYSITLKGRSVSDLTSQMLDIFRTSVDITSGNTTSFNMLI